MEQAEDSKKFFILITDDDEGDRKNIRRALSQSNDNYDVTEVFDIKSALEACECQDFDCAIVDYRMPGYDGLEGIVMLKQHCPYMGIIMATGHGDENLASEAFKRGVSDYIPKNYISKDSLNRAVENTMEKVKLRKRIDDQRDALENFASVLTHDLLSPLKQISELSDMIMDSVENQKNEEARHHCLFIGMASKHAINLVQTLAEYNQADSTNVTFGDVSMNDIVEGACQNLAHDIAQNGARITHDDLPNVNGNAPQLVQLLQNLIGNGIKYCEVEIPAIHISSENVDGNIVFSVQDNGIGIAASYQETIFEPFRRLHTNSEFEGTGLGLATCKKIIERHGGKIWCRSEEGRGTTFYFTLSGS